MSTYIYLLTIGLPMATILLVVGIRVAGRVAEAKANQQGAAAQQEVLDGLAEIKTRLAAIEKILKEVE